MSLDAALLAAAVAAGPAALPTLRLYQWRRPTLSLGYHQRQLPPRWRPALERGAVELVRRPSGGRAVLHAGELTYALIWPQAPERRSEAYRLACQWLQAAFAVMGQPLSFGAQAASAERSSCFATSTAADLVHADGGKRIGSAQLWRSGCLLQHGSILLAPPSPLWRELFDHDPPPLAELPLAGAALMALLRRCAEHHWLALGGRALELRPLGPAERAAIRTGRQHYRVPAGAGEGWGDTSPAATMPRAT
ncbi:MAG: lipoate--protein ligase family protein [Synechococcaceae cyanobacterium]|nr:lipoate--protein ligase family protein [Synechococcaceae cyanobacterium]